ncbi:MAG: hypothetical protein V1790_06115 [Planctomycetota bacterium]
MRRRMFLALTCLVLGYSTYALGQQPPQAADDADQPKATISEATIPGPGSSRAVETLLRKRVDAIDWRDKPFEDVLAWLRDNGEGRVNILPKWGQLGVENVKGDSLITLQLNNTTVADVLNETLDQLSEKDTESQLRYRGIGNKLTISTRQDFERRLYVRIYDATDILFRVPDFGRNAPVIDLQKSSQGGGAGGGGGSGQSVFGGAGGGASGSQESGSGQQAEQENETRLKKLKDLIQATIARESWDLTGTQGAATPGAATGRGRIEIFNSTLVISNTIEVHEMIAGAFSFGD